MPGSCRTAGLACSVMRSRKTSSSPADRGSACEATSSSTPAAKEPTAPSTYGVEPATGVTWHQGSDPFVYTSIHACTRINMHAPYRNTQLASSPWTYLLLAIGCDADEGEARGWTAAQAQRLRSQQAARVGVDAGARELLQGICVSGLDAQLPALHSARREPSLTRQGDRKAHQ